MGSRNAIAIDLSRRRLRAVQGSSTHRDLRIHNLLVEDVPADLNFEDAGTVGRWLAERLHAARIGGGPATLSVGREHVGLKRITLPTTDPAELPDMTRLAMQRELPFDADSAVIDFVPVERGNTGTTVLAVAVPRTQIDFLREMAEAAGLKVKRIALRTMGAAALINALVEQDAGVRVEDVDRLREEGVDSAATTPAKSSPVRATLAVDVVGEGVEFCIVGGAASEGPGGSIQFSRAAEVPAPQDELAMAEAVVTEARRTWMSYRVGEEGGGIGAAVIMGDRRVAEYAAGPVGEMLRLPVRVLREHPRVDAGAHDLSRVWPLTGLLLEGEFASERIDFLHPRKALDLGARKRVRWLVAAAAIIVVGGAGFTLMRSDLRSLQREADQLATFRTEGAAGYDRYDRDKYKLSHLQQWTGVHVDWLDHAAFLAKAAPPPDQIVLDSWSGSIEFRGVTFDPRKGAWAANHQATIVIEGEARDRSTADAFREALVKSPIYVARTTGTDTKSGKRMPVGFTYRLFTHAEAPEQDRDEQTKADAAEGDGEKKASTDSAAPGDNAAHDEAITQPAPQ